jgi:hypothetical protein
MVFYPFPSLSHPLGGVPFRLARHAPTIADATGIRTDEQGFNLFVGHR